MSDISDTVTRYLNEAERIAGAVDQNGPDKDKAAVIAELARQIRDFRESTDATTRSMIEHAILFAVSTEDLTTGHLWKKPVDDYIKRTETLRTHSQPMIRKEDIQEAEKAHKTREEQARALGCDPRHLRRLRNKYGLN